MPSVLMQHASKENHRLPRARQRGNQRYVKRSEVHETLKKTRMPQLATRPASVNGVEFLLKLVEELARLSDLATHANSANKEREHERLR